MKGLAAVCAIGAFFGGVFGLALASQATAGVAVLAFCCLLAILSRVFQASSHHEALMKQIEDARSGKPVPVDLSSV